MLVKKRIQQQDAIKKMLEIKDGKKEKEMIGLLLNKIFETLVKSLEKLASQTKNAKDLKMDKDTMNGSFFLFHFHDNKIISF